MKLTPSSFSPSRTNTISYPIIPERTEEYAVSYKRYTRKTRMDLCESFLVAYHRSNILFAANKKFIEIYVPFQGSYRSLSLTTFRFYANKMLKDAGIPLSITLKKGIPFVKAEKKLYPFTKASLTRVRFSYSISRYIAPIPEREHTYALFILPPLFGQYELDLTFVEGTPTVANVL